MTEAERRIFNEIQRREIVLIKEREDRRAKEQKLLEIERENRELREKLDQVLFAKLKLG